MRENFHTAVSLSSFGGCGRRPAGVHCVGEMRRRSSSFSSTRAGGSVRAIGAIMLLLASGWACGGLSQNDLGSGGGGALPSTGGAAGGFQAAGGADPGGGVSSGGEAPSGSGGSVASGGADPGGAPSSSGGALPSGPECEVDEDCQIAKDCCNCHAVPTGAVTAACKADCGDSNACELQGIHAVPRCSWGKCTVTNCDPVLVSCDSLPPECPSGQTASVTEDACWGPCVAFAECVSVPDCNACGDDYCVQRPGLGSLPFHCIAPQLGCEAGNLCECMDPCDGIGCVEQDDQVIACYCPSC
jgi:hypothetical protein